MEKKFLSPLIIFLLCCPNVFAMEKQAKSTSSKPKIECESCALIPSEPRSLELYSKHLTIVGSSKYRTIDPQYPFTKTTLKALITDEQEKKEWEKTEIRLVKTEEDITRPHVLIPKTTMPIWLDDTLTLAMYKGKKSDTTTYQSNLGKIKPQLTVLWQRMKDVRTKCHSCERKMILPNFGPIKAGIYHTYLNKVCHILATSKSCGQPPQQYPLTYLKATLNQVEKEAKANKCSKIQFSFDPKDSTVPKELGYEYENGAWTKVLALAKQ